MVTYPSWMRRNELGQRIASRRVTRRSFALQKGGGADRERTVCKLKVEIPSTVAPSPVVLIGTDGQMHICAPSHR